MSEKGSHFRKRASANSTRSANMMSVVSMLKLQNMQSKKNKFWRRRGGSSRMSLISNTSSDSKLLVDVEEEFLHAAEFGDIPTVRRLLHDNPDLNVDCIDALGRTALRLAVKNEHLEVVEVLLEKSSSRHIYEAVLQAISAGHVQIAESILKHKRYLELWKERRKLGDDDHFFKTEFEESQFSPDITPLILSSQKNQYEIVQLLLLRGERIQKPHKFGCLCRECVNKMKFDQLRSAKYRLNAYRGMSSEAYISLSSKDPILTAFQLSRELKVLSRNEKCFKQEYIELSNQLSEYVVKLLDRVRNQEELDLVLNKTGKASEEKYGNLERLQLALHYSEKKFVAHPSCQQRLDRSWSDGMGYFLKCSIVKRIFIVMMFMLAYPFLIMLYIVSPKSNIKALKVLHFPWVKFVLHSMSFVSFLLMLIVSTLEATYVLRKNITLGSDFPLEFKKYATMQNYTASSLYGPDLPVRPLTPSATQVLLSLWIIGFLYRECTQIYNEGAKNYFSSLYNYMDIALLTGYICSFTLKYATMFKGHIALAYLRDTEQHAINANKDDTLYSLYWITADRYYWDKWDPINLAEGMFAIASVLSFARLSYLLPANEALGPLQISLGRMIKDIVKFLCLAVLVLVAFMIGLQNLYWYYNVHEHIEVEKRDFDVPAQEFFGDSLKAFRTVFWSLFGRGEASVVQLNEYDNSVTEDVGYIIYGSYNIVMVTVLMNMLIAMMARSFQAIAEESDVEWKFARSLLYMDYIKEAEVLPVPINLIRIPRAMLEWVFECCQEDTEELLEDFDNAPNGIAANMPVSRNGVEPMTHVSDVATTMKTLSQTPSVSSADPSAVEIYEANAGNKFQNAVNKKKNGHRPSLPGFLDSNKKYQKVMQRIVQRYIFDIQREAEVTEDDFEEIKQDISSFRYDMLNVLRSREQQMAEVTSVLARINTALGGTAPSTTTSFDSPSHRGSVKLANVVRDRLISQDRRSLDSCHPSEDIEMDYGPEVKLSPADDDAYKGNNYSRDEEFSADNADQDLEGNAEGQSDGEMVEPARYSDDEECFVVENQDINDRENEKF